MASMTQSQMSMLDVGFGNVVPKHRVVALVSYESDPVHRSVQEMEKMHRVIDATKGRKVRTVLYLDSSHIVLSSIAREKLWERLETKSPFFMMDHQKILDL